MGKTIDKTIEFFNGLECHTPQAQDARDVAIETMRKYQKIEQIIRNYDVSWELHHMKFTIDEIRKVVEDE